LLDLGGSPGHWHPRRLVKPLIEVVAEEPPLLSRSMGTCMHGVIDNIDICQQR